MPARKYWQASQWRLPSGSTLELSEAQLTSAGVRVDVPATLTANRAPDSGTLAGIKDNSTGTGALWNGIDGSPVVLSWEFAGAQNVDSMILGSRTTVGRLPQAFVLQGGAAVGAWDVTIGFGGIVFASAVKIGPLMPGIAALATAADQQPAPIQRPGR